MNRVLWKTVWLASIFAVFGVPMAAANGAVKVTSFPSRRVRHRRRRIDREIDADEREPRPKGPTS